MASGVAISISTDFHTVHRWSFDIECFLIEQIGRKKTHKFRGHRTVYSSFFLLSRIVNHFEYSICLTYRHIQILGMKNTLPCGNFVGNSSKKARNFLILAWMVFSLHNSDKRVPDCFSKIQYFKFRTLEQTAVSQPVILTDLEPILNYELGNWDDYSLWVISSNFLHNPAKFDRLFRSYLLSCIWTIRWEVADIVGYRRKYLV